MTKTLLPPDPVSCQHCERLITQTAAGDWVDSDGFMVCQKWTGDLSELPGAYLFHEPMPKVN